MTATGLFGLLIVAVTVGAAAGWGGYQLGHRNGRRSATHVIPALTPASNATVATQPVPARPPRQAPQVVRTPPPAMRTPGDLPQRKPNTHVDMTRSRVSPVGRRWKPDVTHTHALPATTPAKEVS